MSPDLEKQREIALLVAALRSESDDPELDQLARFSILASIADDDILNDIAVAEVGPEQAELDLHLDGQSIENHSARAEPFGLFITRTAEAVKEMSKAKLGRERYTADLLISPAMPGSLRVVLRSPDRHDKKHTELGSTSTSNVESDSLRTLAILLSQAGENSDLQPGIDADSSPIDATIQQLPAVARERVRAAVQQVVSAGWSVEGELRQRGIGIVKIHLANERAALLGDQLSQTESKVEKNLNFTGTIDGTRRFTGTMWFKPQKSLKPFVASVTDANLLEKVNELNAFPDAIVTATFDRFVVHRAGTDSIRARSTTYALTAIERLESTTQPELLT